MKHTAQTTITLLVFLLALSVPVAGQSDAKKYQEYPSKFKKRGNVHGLVLIQACTAVYGKVTQSFTNLGLTINYEEPALGYIEGGRSRGVAGEIVRVWVDPEENGQCRVEVRNIRVSRMGLIGFTATKDWSVEVLDALNKGLGDLPALAQLRSAVEAQPENIEARRQLIESLLAAEKFDETAGAYRALLAKFPKSNLDRLKFSELLVKHGQIEPAIEVLKQSEGDDQETKFSLARIYMQTRQHDAAIAILTHSVQGDQGEIKARYQLARAACLAGDAATAKANFSAVIEKAPQHPFAEQAKVWLKLTESGPLKNPLEAKTALALCELLDKEGLNLLAQYYLESLSDAASATEKRQGQRMMAKLYQQSHQYAAITRLLEPQTEQLKQEKQGELLYALCLAYCGQRDFNRALNCLKLAQKAGYKPPKEFQEALKLYQS